jgi:hypothetical protein
MRALEQLLAITGVAVVMYYIFTSQQAASVIKELGSSYARVVAALQGQYRPIG